MFCQTIFNFNLKKKFYFFKKYFPIKLSFNYLIFIIIFQNIYNYSRLIEKLVKGHLERAIIEFDKIAAPLSPIELLL
jgi:hypothetical protein